MQELANSLVVGRGESFPKLIIVAVQAAVVLVAAHPNFVRGHGDVHDRIAALNEEIKRSPTRADLYFARGELHCAHAEWEKGLADYAQVARLDPGMKALDLALGQALLAAGRPNDAKTALDRCLAGEPYNNAALIARARAFSKLGRLDDSVGDFTEALNRAVRPDPEVFLERADVQVAAGRALDAANGLDEAIRKIGPLLVIQLHLVDLLVREKRYDDALSRLDSILKQTPRKETWLARRGEILLEARRFSEASQAYGEALKSLTSLPAYRRKSRAMQDLEASILLGMQKANLSRSVPSGS